MNTWQSSRLVESSGMAVLKPFLDERCDGVLMLNNGPLAKVLQETRGDMMCTVDGQTKAIEVKVEERNSYGNLFLEMWSNRNLEDRINHITHGTNPGWLIKQRADLLFYYFLEDDDLFILDLFKLKQWALGHGVIEGRVHKFPLRCQSKRTQMNDTWGYCVPIQVIESEVGCKKIHPRQLTENEGKIAA